MNQHGRRAVSPFGTLMPRAVSSFVTQRSRSCRWNLLPAMEATRPSGRSRFQASASASSCAFEMFERPNTGQAITCSAKRLAKLRLVIWESGSTSRS